MPEKFDHALHDPTGAAIHAKEKNSEKCHRDNHDPGGHKTFMPCRPGHLAHLDANFVKKSAPPAGIFAEILKGLGDCVPAPRAASAATCPLILQLQRFRHRPPQIFPKPSLS